MARRVPRTVHEKLILRRTDLRGVGIFHDICQSARKTTSALALAFPPQNVCAPQFGILL